MIRRGLVALAAAIVCATAAQAEVVSHDAQGFTVRHTVETPHAPAQAYRAFINVAAWWDGAHTYSGDAGNLWLDARFARRPAGCWCERLPGGGLVRHMDLVYADPGKSLRLLGALGPLQEMGANGAMTVAFTPLPGGGSRVAVTYVVSGRSPGGWQAIAGAVDRVLGQQLARYGAQGRP